MRIVSILIATLATLALFYGATPVFVPHIGPATARAFDPPTKPPAAAASTPLFNGKNLDGWKSTQFGGEGEVSVEEGVITIATGYSLSGITCTQELPKTNYEITLEARRVEGIDFFCGLTFPVAESHCSFIVGGWAGSVVGLSSIDGQDASENDTTRYMKFEKGRWYRIRVRVTPERISAWIDDERVVDQDIRGRKLSTRVEVELSKPLGICTWETKAELRNIRLTKLDPAAPGPAPEPGNEAKPENGQPKPGKQGSGR